MTPNTYASLAGRTAIVTGGASGIGEAIVRAFVANGSQVAFLDVQDEAGQALEGALDGKARFFRCDLLDIDAIRATFAHIHQALGPAAVLVSNAANDQRQTFADVTPEAFDFMMNVNFRHVFFAAQCVLPQMRELGFGSIVNLSSIAWMNGGRDMEAYTAAKAAVVGFTNSLARDVGEHKIRVNAVAPGMVVTERQRRLWWPDESGIAAMRARQCIPDAVEPEDIAAAVLFLASDDSRMITKQCIMVNGGAR